MANATSIQILEDGPRNVVVKVEGILDTSDMAATGQIGASGFTTAIGSPNITFVAGALPPTVGQFLTFSDGTTTFDAGTYVVSITDATHIVVSKNAKALNAAAAITITGTAGSVVILDPSKLAPIDNYDGKLATKVSIVKLVYDIEDLLQVNLYWNATAPVRIMPLTGRDHQGHYAWGGLQNNAGTGVDGKILASTQGWSASASLAFSVILHCIKQ